MSVNRNISILIGIIGVLILLLSGSIGYIIYQTEDFSKNDKVTNNSKILKEISELKSLYDAKIADKTNSYVNLQIQKDSIETLLKALENSKENEHYLLKYKTEFHNLESKMKILVDEIVVLKSRKTKAVVKKEVLVAENTSDKSKTSVVKKELQIKKAEKNNNEVLTTSKLDNSVENPVKSTPEIQKSKVKKNSRLALSNVKAMAFSSKSASKKVETVDASKTDFIKISFDLKENQDVENGEKTFYFQVINSNNNVMGKRITEYFDRESLTYSFSKTFSYDNQSVQISQEFFDSNFSKGYYFINIFDRNELVGKTSILLK